AWLCDRRRQPGRSQGGGDAARRGVRRRDHADRRRAGAPLRAAAAVQGLPARPGGEVLDLRARRGLVRRARRGPAARRGGDPHRPGRPAGGAGRRQPGRLRKLLITTGASPRRLGVPGGDLDGVLYLRTVADCERLAAAFRGGGALVIAGAGWIGLEAAAAAREAGCEVTVAEPAPSALHHALGPELGGMFADLHREHGVTFRFGEGVAEFRGAGGRLSAVVTSSGAELAADIALVAIGVVPNAGLAEAAGL